MNQRRRYPNILVVSHQRSGTHLTIDTIINNLAPFRSQADTHPITIDRLSAHMHKTTPTLSEVIARLRQGPTVLKSHSHANFGDFFEGPPELAELIEETFDRSRIIYVCRDGRDVMVSLYFYLNNMDPGAAGIEFSDFLRMDNDVDAETYPGRLDRPSYWAFHAGQWLRNGNVLPIWFDQILSDPYTTLQEISDFTEMPLIDTVRNMTRSRKGLGYLVEKLRSRLPIDAISGKKYSSVRFRKGESGDWVNWFSEDDIEFFDARAGSVNALRRESWMTPQKNGRRLPELE